jgi:cytochrome c peroxidase
MNFRQHSTKWKLGLSAALLGAAGCSASADGMSSVDFQSSDRALSPKKSPVSRTDNDDSGTIESASTNQFNSGSTAGFFANLGNNGRTCNSCHLQQDGWGLSAADVQKFATNDPLFQPNDGSDCPPLSAAQAPNARLSSQLVNYGLIRVQIGIPSGANFSLGSASNPQACAIAPGSAGAGGQLFLFRRPLPSTNLIFDSSVMWDGRETVQLPNTTAGQQSLSALLFDLGHQADDATTGHAQGASIAGTAAQGDIVAFEDNLYSAQVLQQFQHVGLDQDGARGGAAYLSNTVASQFFVGINDPLKPGFTNSVFDLFSAWEPGSANSRSLEKSELAIGRGEALFNNARFTIHDVPGLNSFPDDPLYNPADPLAGQDIVAGCGLCHNSPNVGNHSTALTLNIGVTLADPINNDGSPNEALDLSHLPVYQLSNGTSTVSVTDPGKALISGKFTDIGKTKGPILRGLASRAPYFHNGSAATLTDVVDFYNARFEMGLTDAQVSDLVAFLGAL